VHRNNSRVSPTIYIFQIQIIDR